VAVAAAAAALYERLYVCVTVTGGRGGARRERLPEVSAGRRHKSTHRHFDWELEILAWNWQGSAAHPYIRLQQFSRRRKAHHTNKVEGTGRSLDKDKATGQGEWWTGGYRFLR